MPYCSFISIQVFTGTTPFSHCSPYTTALAILRGERPHQPTHPAFTEDLWVLVQRCWDKDPHQRPEVPEVLDVLHSLSVSGLFLQQLRRLNRSSSGFHDQLTKILYGKDYQQCAPNLQGNDLVWLINYLDKVWHYITFSHPCSRYCRLSMVLTPPVQPSGSIYMNFKTYVVRVGSSHCHACFHLPLSRLVLNHLPQVALVMCTRGPSMVQQFVSNMCECILIIHKRPLCPLHVYH